MQKLKEYAISAGYTFLAGFIPVLWLGLSSPALTWDNALEGSFWVGLLLAGIRAGMKALMEFVAPQIPVLVNWLKSKAK